MRDGLISLAFMTTAFTITWTAVSLFVVASLDAPLWDGLSSIARIIVFAPGYASFLLAAWLYERGLAVDPYATALIVAVVLDLALFGVAVRVFVRA